MIAKLENKRKMRSLYHLRVLPLKAFLEFMTKKPKLKGGAKQRSKPCPLGEIPRETAILIGKQIVHRLAIGHADITGDDFGGIFARAIEGEHRSSPLGIVDVVWNGCA